MGGGDFLSSRRGIAELKVVFIAVTGMLIDCKDTSFLWNDKKIGEGILCVVYFGGCSFGIILQIDFRFSFFDILCELKFWGGEILLIIYINNIYN